MIALVLTLLVCSSLAQDVKVEAEIPITTAEVPAEAPVPEAVVDDVVGETDIVDDPTKFEDEGGVFVLDPENFDSFIEDFDTVMVEFYAPWCGHCKQLAPEYEAAAKQMKKDGIKAVLAKVDVDKYGDLGTRFAIQGFPTLKIFKKGSAEPIDYEGARDKDGIIEKMAALSDPNWEPPKSEVIVLTEASFDEVVNKEPIMLVEFFAPWCGHCKKLKPEFEKAARELADDGVKLATVDATVEKELGKRFDVSGYPTLKIFRNGKMSDYKGERTKDGIISTMLTEKTAHSIHYSTKYELTRLEKPETVVVIALLPGLTVESDTYKLYEELTNDYRESYECYHVTDKAWINKQYKVSVPTLVVRYPANYVAKKEKAYSAIPLTSTITELRAFVSANNKPLVGDYDCNNCDKIYDAVDTVRIYTSKDSDKKFDKNTKYWQEKAASVARSFHNKGLYFVLCDEAKQAADMASMKLTDLGVETVFGIKSANGNKYAPTADTLDDMDDFSETLEEFVEDYLKGKLKVLRKSAAVPKKQGPVVTVVGSTFDQIVLDKSKDVLIEFYAPWCGHCKALEPKYLELAKSLKNEKNLVIAKLDGTLNEFPNTFAAQGYPTIYFVPAGKEDSPIQFNGNREVDDMTKFMKEHVVASLGGGKKDEL